ncbi:MAG TPA: hypothetical protein VKE94_10330 [Gemmataceae bacterium]|nr:hypothetical protein [Gemmataceae bacterium]
MRRMYDSPRTRGVPGLMALAGVALLCASCTKEKLSPVRGQVLFQGKPVPDAFVVFHPVGFGDLKVLKPHGRTDKEGWFTLSTNTEKDGVAPGEYVVTVEWRPLIAAGDGDLSPGPNRLPERYSKPETSKLRVQISQGSTELSPFELK